MSLLELGPGIYPGVPAAEYHARVLGLASNSGLALVSHAPALYRAWVAGDAETEETPALAFGRAFHCAVFEPDEFARLYAVQPVFGDCRTKGPRDARDAWRAAHADRTWLSSEDAKSIEGMTAALRRHPMAGPLLRAPGQCEVTCRWTDPESGVECKGRGDKWIPGLRSLLDLKSTEDARPSAFRRACELFHYDSQESFYRRGWACVDEPIDDFPFVAVEKTPPHLVAVYTLHAANVDEADWENRKALRLLADCLARDEWPGLDPTIRELKLRPWRLEQ